MSEHDHSGDLSRRHFSRLILAGAAVSIVPVGAQAAEAAKSDAKAADCPKVTPVPALAVMCIDYRLVNPGVEFFNRHIGLKKYDIVALAGASLAAGSPEAFKETVEAFYQQVEAAWTLHRIQKVVFIDHLDCGAFKVEFNHGCDFSSPAEELHYHRQVAEHVAEDFPKRTAHLKPAIGLEFWIFRNPNNPMAVPLELKQPR